MVNFFIVVEIPQTESAATPDQEFEALIDALVHQLSIESEEFGASRPTDSELREFALRELGLK